MRVRDLGVGKDVRVEENLTSSLPTSHFGVRMLAVFSFRPMAAQNELQKICQPLPSPDASAALNDSPSRQEGEREGGREAGEEG